MNVPEFAEIESLDGLSNSSFLEHSILSPVSYCHLSSSPSLLPPCRRFWNAGEYFAGDAPQSLLKTNQNCMRVHPKFLHSNATSHKWAFGALAELLDNALDEAHNGATFVIVDKIANLRNGHALLIQDNGGGMDPESLRHCMSFGFSDKRSDSTIGQYGNGFKTSTMRLGSDVIVFSRCLKERTLTQSVGLLSYTFLRQSGCNDVIVPMVDYKLDSLSGGFVRMTHRSQKQFCDNLSILLRWSPFAKEEELLTQFDLVGCHGTRIIVFNLWLNDAGYPELDFDTNKKDIIISGAHKAMHSSKFAKDNEKHIGNLFRYSLRAYSSILYLRLPENFMILLRGEHVDPHYIAEDLVYRQCIKYKPLVSSTIESEEIDTVIGFLNGAPYLDIHGFNVYHKKRLIMPFWRVTQKCKGVVGVLQADCMKPAHDKQDFEKSNIFHKLEARLKCMALEYWKFHCDLVGYSAIKISPSSQLPPGYQMYRQEQTENIQELFPKRRRQHAQEVVMNSKQQRVAGTHHDAESFTICHQSSAMDMSGITSVDRALQRSSGSAHHLACEEVTVAHSPVGFRTPDTFCTNCDGKSNSRSNISAAETLKEQAVVGGISPSLNTKPKVQIQHVGGMTKKHALRIMVLRRQQLNEQCMQLEKSVKELELKEEKLRRELQVVLQVFNHFSAELKPIDMVKIDKS